MFDFVTSWLIQHKVLLPGATTLSRLISEIRERATNRLWQRLSSLPTDEQKVKLETLLQIPEGQRASRFDQYRKGPVTISGPAFKEAVKRYQEPQAFGLQELDFSHIPPVRLKTLARHAGVISMHKIARMPDEKGVAILVAFVKAFETIALDDALDVLDLLITDIAGEAKKLGKKKRLRTLKDLDKSALALAEVCALILNEETEDARLREAIFSRYPKAYLAESIATVNKLARPSDDRFHDEMVEQYGRVRRFLPQLLDGIGFKAAPGGETTIDALNYLASLGKSRKQILDNPPLEIISTPWKRLVCDKEGRVTRKGYVLCFLDTLQDSLRRRGLYVENSDRWGDPRAKLLRDADWQANRIQVCRSLGHPVSSHEAVAKLTQHLDAAYKNVAANFDENHAVRIEHSGKHPTLTITNLDKLEEPKEMRLNAGPFGLLATNDITTLSVRCRRALARNPRSPRSHTPHLCQSSATMWALRLSGKEGSPPSTMSRTGHASRTESGAPTIRSPVHRLPHRPPGRSSLRASARVFTTRPPCLRSRRSVGFISTLRTSCSLHSHRWQANLRVLDIELFTERVRAITSIFPPGCIARRQFCKICIDHSSSQS